MGQRSLMKENNTAEVMEKLLGKKGACEGGVPMTVRDLIEQVDKDLMVIVYGRDENRDLKHGGFFAPKIEKSLNDLLSKFGEVPVMDYDIYKQYVLVYLDE